MDKLIALLKSRKFYAAVLGVVGVVLVELAGLDEASAELIVKAIMAIVSAFILGTALEDGLRG